MTYDDVPPEAPPQPSRSNKVRANLKAIGLVRVELWVPAAEVEHFKALEAASAQPLIDAARQHGHLLEQRESMTDDKKRKILKLVASGCSRAEAARQCGVHKSTVTRLLAHPGKP